MSKCKKTKQKRKFCLWPSGHVLRLWFRVPQKDEGSVGCWCGLRTNTAVRHGRVSGTCELVLWCSQHTHQADEFLSDLSVWIAQRTWMGPPPKSAWCVLGWVAMGIVEGGPNPAQVAQLLKPQHRCNHLKLSIHKWRASCRDRLASPQNHKTTRVMVWITSLLICGVRLKIAENPLPHSFYPD